MAIVTRNLNNCHIEYAKDPCLVLLPEDKKEEAISEIKTVAEPHDLYLNESKTEVLELSRELLKLESANNYLGLKIGNSRACIEGCLSKANFGR